MRLHLITAAALLLSGIVAISAVVDYCQALSSVQWG